MPTASPVTAPGLRDRKRAEARDRTVNQALRLCLEHGYDAVTVDMICEASDISQRTFFNYFGSKEAAIIGDATLMPTDEAAREFIDTPGDRILPEFLDLLVSGLERYDGNADLIRRRRLVMNATPELAALKMASIAEAREHLKTIVQARLEASRTTDATDDQLAIDAATVVGVCLGIVQFASSSWLAEDPAPSLRDLALQSLTSLERLIAAPTLT